MKNYTFKVKRNKKSGTVNINLTGQLNVSFMNDIRDELLKVVNEYKIIDIQIYDVEDADLTLLQMLKAFQNTCEKNRKELKISFDLNDDFNSLFKRAGLLTILN